MSGAYLRRALDEDTVADSVDAQYFMDVVLCVSAQANLVTRDNVPILDAVLGADGLEPRVVLAVSNEPCPRKTSNVVEISD